MMRALLIVTVIGMTGIFTTGVYFGWNLLLVPTALIATGAAIALAAGSSDQP